MFLLAQSAKVIVKTVCLTVIPAALFAQGPQHEQLPQQINSAHAELRPLISENGQILYFSRVAHPENNKGEDDEQDVYRVQKVGSRWGTPENLGSPFNNRDANSLCSVSPDGQELLMINAYKKVKGPLVRFCKTDTGWGTAEAVTIKDYQNDSDYLDFFQSYTAHVLFMAVEREGTLGDQDIYISFPQKNGSWSKPVNLGSTINTKQADFAPFLAADGRTLYFSSYGHKGYGGADLYVSQRLDDSWTKWSAPVNLGNTINTVGEETYCSVTAEGTLIYYASYLPGSSKRDLFVSTLPQYQLKTAPVVPEVQLVEKEVSTTPVAPAVVAREEDRSLPVQAATSPLATEHPSAAATVTAVDQQQQVLTASSRVSAEHVIQRGQLKFRQVTPETPGSVMYRVHPNLYYNFNRDTSEAVEHQKLLQEIILYLQEHPTASLRVVGHADERGTEAGNVRISRLRAEKIQQALVQKGIAAARVQVLYRGAQEPIATNDDDRDGRALNRRVELIITVPVSKR